jgi:hypothetical protein
MLKKHIACLLRLALCVALLNALAPTASYLLAAWQGKPLAEICTSFGVRKVAVGGDQDRHVAEKHIQTAECAFCLSCHGAVALIQPAAFKAHTPFAAQAPAPSVSDPFVPRRRWSDSPPRAPPAWLS